MEDALKQDAPKAIAKKVAKNPEPDHFIGWTTCELFNHPTFKDYTWKQKMAFTREELIERIYNPQG